MTKKEKAALEKELKECREIYGGIAEVVRLAEYMRNAYFWKGDHGNQKRRDWYDAQHSAEFSWTEGGHEYSAGFFTRSSRHNIYTTRSYYFDGERTNLTKIKNSMKRIGHRIDELEKALGIGPDKGAV